MDLRLKLDDRDFDALATIARSMVPSLAPEWTDHNVHDPGIMLTELMAWVTEAQIYSLARIRNDEKAAFARLLGIAPSGPRPAIGLIWPLEPGEPGHLEGVIGGQSLERWSTVVADRAGLPRFRLVNGQYLTSAKLIRVQTLSADGRDADHTGLNRKNGATFLPFGASPTSGDRLKLTFDGDRMGPGGKGAFVLGVEVDGVEPMATAEGSAGPGVDVSLVRDKFSRRLRVERDTTMGFARSGIIALSIPAEIADGQGAAAQKGFQLVLSPRSSGFLRPPRVRRLAVNVLEVEQAETVVDDEAYFGQGLPDQAYLLQAPNGILDAGLTIEVDGRAWSLVDDLDDCAPDAEVFIRDPATGLIAFGNGINGKMPPKHASLKVTRDVSYGAVGNAPPGVGWTLRGVAGVFGRNSQSFAHGRDRLQSADIQAEARGSLSGRTTYVTPGDLEHAALAMTDLGVVRSCELPIRLQDHAGVRGLLVAGTSDPANPFGLAPENPRWIEAIRSRLAPHLPVGQHLYVVGPEYVGLRIAATLTIADRADAADVVADAMELLKSKFQNSLGTPIWDFGRNVTALQVMGWLRKLDLVLAVGNTVLYRDGQAQTGAVELSAKQLPRFDGVGGDITIVRRGAGGQRR